MRIALIQGKIFWEQPEKNLKYFLGLMKKVSPGVQMVVLPEAFTTGFTMNVKKLSRLASFPIEEWLADKALEINKIIVAGAFVQEQGKFYNRMFWVEPNGTVYHYNKRHLFTYSGENRIFTPGKRQVIVQKQDFKFHLQICYDLRFPVWNANRYDRRTDAYAYDVLLYIAHWPARRKNAYLPLLRARAIENQAYVLWVNRVGRDGSRHVYSGDTRIIHPSGQVLALVKSHNEGILEYDLSYKELQKYRENFPVGPDWDDFRIIID